jgi:hypothetical protein
MWRSWRKGVADIFDPIMPGCANSQLRRKLVPGANFSAGLCCGLL